MASANKWFLAATATVVAASSGTLAMAQPDSMFAPRTVSATCSFATPHCHLETNGYSTITIDGCTIHQVQGRPQMPFRTIRLLLPPSSTVTGISFAPLKDPTELEGRHKLSLGHEPSSTRDDARATSDAGDVPHPGVYDSTNTYPVQQVELASVQRLAGHVIAVLRVFPLQYTPSAGRLVFMPAMTINVTLSTGRNQIAPTTSSTPPSGLSLDRLRVAALVDNPESLQEYDYNPPAAPALAKSLGDSPAYNYLLVTGASLLPSFAPLVDFHVNQGLAVKTETIETITNNYTGRDSAEKLRNYIRYACTNWGVRYVLLGGDVGVVPTRGVYAHCSGQTLATMPSDLYFACLDGSWDGNGNGVWGEPTDGDSGGDVDLLAEVFVGRAPVETTTEVDNFVTKTLAAQSNTQNRFHVCLAGEFLGYVDGAFAQGGDALDTLVPSISNSLSTATWLDDRPSHDSVWSTADAISVLNNSPLLVAHYGHTDDSTVMRMGVSDVASLNNALPFLFYSTGCDAGAFDNFSMSPDCIGEELVKGNKHGAFAAIVNTRNGWFDGHQEWLYSGEYQKRFFDGILTGGRSYLGEAHQLAKQDMIGNVETSGNMPYRWCYFGITLLGDPCVVLDVPLSICLRPTPTPSAIVVRWNSRTNTLYSLYRTTDLVEQQPICLQSNIVATPPLNIYTDLVSGVNQAFFWTRAQP